jgi:hypothetical protein
VAATVTNRPQAAPSAPALSDLQLFLARAREQNWKRNELTLQRLFWGFRLATMTLVMEVIVWVVALS